VHGCVCGSEVIASAWVDFISGVSGYTVPNMRNGQDYIGFGGKAGVKVQF
jgi:hypothetical protein